MATAFPSVAPGGLSDRQQWSKGKGHPVKRTRERRRNMAESKKVCDKSGISLEVQQGLSQTSLSLRSRDVQRGGKYLEHMSDFVSTEKGKCFTLKKPAGAKLKKADLEDTIYRDEEEVVNGWGKFYLPSIVKMQVVGVVEGTSCPCDELVLMTCEDKQVYAYDGEELHLVASDLVQVFEEGIEYPASKTYYEGEAFKDMTKKDWAKVRKGTVGKRLDQEHHKRVTAKKSRFLENLRKTRQTIGVIS